MLTALGEMDDKMEAFGAGADDYIVKPFNIKELIARINVFIKRSLFSFVGLIYTSISFVFLL